MPHCQKPVDPCRDFILQFELSLNRVHIFKCFTAQQHQNGIHNFLTVVFDFRLNRWVIQFQGDGHFKNPAPLGPRQVHHKGFQRYHDSNRGWCRSRCLYRLSLSYGRWCLGRGVFGNQILNEITPNSSDQDQYHHQQNVHQRTPRCRFFLNIFYNWLFLSHQPSSPCLKSMRKISQLHYKSI